jgi:hypothetical protein
MTRLNPGLLTHIWPLVHQYQPNQTAALKHAGAGGSQKNQFPRRSR